MTNKETRRNVLKALLAGGLGTVALSLEEKILVKRLSANTDAPVLGDDDFEFASRYSAAKYEVDGATGATRTSFELPKRAALNEKLPCSTLCGIKLSRVILGGNLLTGFVHSRDLVYVGRLARSYNTKEKVYETMQLAEECGMNAFVAYPGVVNMLRDYYNEVGGEIRYISDCRSPAQIRKAVDFGAKAVYLNGDWSDGTVAQGGFDALKECIDTAHGLNRPCGLGAHRIETLVQAVTNGIRPDFFMKTYHSRDYWSAENTRELDNIFCRDAEETRAFMADRPEPWIAFKVCAAGAIMSEVGLRYAFEGGADFVALGMFDFQLVDNVNAAVGILKSDLRRTRPWQSPSLPPWEPGEEEDGDDGQIG